jgi:tight adherence protein C
MQTADTLGQIGRYGFAGYVEPRETPGPRGFIDDAAAMLGAFFVDRLHVFDEESLRKQLVSAGMYGTSPRMLMGYQVLCTVALPAAWLWLALATGRGVALTIIGLLLAGVVGWVGPTFLVRQKADARLYRIDYDMPELIDLLVVTVEAGLGLNASLQLASERLRGPLGEELRISLQEQRMGLSQLQSLENMLTRCPTAAVRSFVRAMGERLGVSVGLILRSLALEMRKRRRAAAEEKAQKAPIKILFPLVFMIFPAMFVVILGPAVISVFNSLG